MYLCMSLSVFGLGSCPLSAVLEVRHAPVRTSDRGFSCHRGRLAFRPSTFFFSLSPFLFKALAVIQMSDRMRGKEGRTEKGRREERRVFQLRVF